MTTIIKAKKLKGKWLLAVILYRA